LDVFPLKGGDVKSLVDLLEHLLLDCGRRSGAAVDRDVQTLRSRVEHEGDSFITITLPAFCVDFERSLAEGGVRPGLWSSFGKIKSGIPAFLQGFLSQVFDGSGVLLVKPNVGCIRSVRQLCLFGKKLLRECSSERLKKAAIGYKECDDGLVDPVGPLWNMFKRVARVLVRDLPLDVESVKTQLMCQHGPGATRERIRGNSKWRFRRWHRRLAAVGLSYKFCVFGKPDEVLANYDGLMDVDTAVNDAEAPEPVEPGDEQPVRVVFVPKTLKTPRVIAVEPVCMQFAQQGLSRLLVAMLEKHRLTVGHVNFTDQTVNQAIALDASGTGTSATLDMSEASDRVSLAHVRGLLEHHPGFLDMVLACRSGRAELPSGEVIHLKKFASMGSALCFPIEALVFYTSIIASRLWRAGKYPTEQNVYSFSRSVRVYGDDLIVPVDEAPAICDDLESLGFEVNRRKSFWTGKFRESCGSDCYDNELVTPVYLRRDLPTSRKDVSGIVSCLSTSNQLYEAGYFSTATALRKAVASCLGANSLPQVPHDSPALGVWSYSNDQPRRRWNAALQRVEALCWTVISPRDVDQLDGLYALAKCFRLIGRSVDSIDPEHLEVSPRPYGLALKRRWVPVDTSSNHWITGL
jgi:hypothetical protein